MPSRNRVREQARARERTDAPSSGVVLITTDAEARALAEALLTVGRDVPYVVITTAAQAPGPYVDAGRLQAELGDLARVCVVPKGSPSWAFSEAMPDAAQVYGGASRVYAPDRAWVERPHLSRLRFAYSPDDGARVLEQLAQDAHAAAFRAGLAGASSGPPRPTETVRGRVRAITAGHAFVVLDDGRTVTVSGLLTSTDVGIDRLLRPGQTVAGPLDADAKRLDLAGLLPDQPASRRLVERAYTDGDVVLTAVVGVARDTVTLRLVPHVTVDVPRTAVTGNDLDDLDDLFTVGEVVLGRYTRDGGGFTLRLDDVDDDEEQPVAAPAVIPGGPPWLVLPEPPASATPLAPAEPACERSEGPVDDEPPSPASPSGTTATQRPTPARLAAWVSGRSDELPAPPVEHTPEPAPRTALRDTQLQLAAERAAREAAEREARGARRLAADLEAETAQLRRDLDAERRTVAQLEHQLAEQKSRYRKADRKRQQTQGEAAPDQGPVFTDPVEQLRFDVLTAWARTVPAAEKAQRPLTSYAVGPRFVESVGVARPAGNKLLEVLVQVLTGRADEVPGRQLHPLRNGTGPASGQRVRDDGARCFRVSLQVNAPAARRLHFWKLTDGTLELSRVVLHDDMEP